MGDCDGNNELRINELVIGVNIVLEVAPVSDCPSFDTNASDSVEINELMQAVNNALDSCLPPCGATSPMCNGACPDNQVCLPKGVIFDFFCACDYSCGDSHFPTCGGTCPSGQVCRPEGINFCGCVPSDNTCSTFPAPMCGGTCPISVEVCRQVGGGPCVCAPLR